MRSILITLTILILCTNAFGVTPPAKAEKTEKAEDVDKSDQKEEKAKNVYMVSTAHLDTQWRWTILETINDFLPNTFEVNSAYIEKFPNYKFSFEGAFRYQLLKEYYPEYYEKIKQYVAEDRWKLSGAWLDAVDVNIPSSESLIRQTLYGNGFYKKEFGKVSRDIFLPDCFGFGYALPSIAAHSGLTGFSSQKLTWGSAYGTPFDIGVWEGVDGSSLIAALNPGSYGSRVRADLSNDTTIARIVNQQGDSTGLYAAYRYFGTGDTGGGPDSASVDWVEKSINSDGPVKVHMIGSGDLAGLITPEQREKLPRYKGELVMTRHGIGCYTSQSAMKRWNRKNEQLVDAAERAAVIAHLMGGYEYPREQLKEAWTRFLWHQFHDDLTGTSIPEAYEFSWNDEILSMNQFASILESAVEATLPALDTKVEGIPIVVYNPLGIERADIVEATVKFEHGAPEAVQVVSPRGDASPAQVIRSFDDSLMIIFRARVPSVGYAVYDIRESDGSNVEQGFMYASDSLMETGSLRVRIDKDGNIASIIDRQSGIEALKEPVQLQVLHDKPDNWAAWELDYDEVMAEPIAVIGGEPQIEVVESGPVRIAVQITRTYNNSTIRQTIRMGSGSLNNLVDVVNDIDWQEKESLLKAAVSFKKPSELVNYDLGCGVIARGLNTPELYEVPGHKWVQMDKADAHYNSIFSDCRYGWDHPDSHTVRLTLIHTPGVPENWSWIDDERSQDIGRHTMRFGIRRNYKSWHYSSLYWEAQGYSQPLIGFQCDKHAGNLGRTYSAVQVYNFGELSIPSQTTALPGFAVQALKLSEESSEIITRLHQYDHHSVDSAKVLFKGAIASAREVNGMEEHMGDATVANGELMISLKAFQTRAFAITMEDEDKPLTKPISTPLTLPFNLDGVSSDGDRLNGNFDNNGNTITGDLLPDTLLYANTTFSFGPTDPGALNVVTCSGQTIDIPEGDHNRLYVLATAIGGPTEGTFVIDDQSYTVPVQDWGEHIGQWDNRMMGSTFNEDPDMIAPAYINRAPVAWVGTHRHNAEGNNQAYQFTYLYSFRFDIDDDTKTFTLPNNPNIRVMAATAVKTGADNIRLCQPLYDVANNTLTEIISERTKFLDTISFEVTTPIPGAEIHYTFDGTDPTIESPLYAGPVTIDMTSTIKAVAFKEGAEDQHITRVEFEQLVPIDALPMSNTVPGLVCTYYEGEWEFLPAFDSLESSDPFIMNTVIIPDTARDEDYGLVFEGFVNVPTEGMYDFYVNSDDGSRMWVAGQLIADNDGLHGDDEMYGEIALKVGLHQLRIEMFQCKGGEALGASVRGPGIKKQQIPKEMLFHIAE